MYVDMCTDMLTGEVAMLVDGVFSYVFQTFHSRKLSMSFFSYTCIENRCKLATAAQATAYCSKLGQWDIVAIQVLDDVSFSH